MMNAVEMKCRESVCCHKILRLCKRFPLIDKPLTCESAAETFCRQCRVEGSASSRLNCVGRPERGRQYNLGQNRIQKRRVVQPGTHHKPKKTVAGTDSGIPGIEANLAACDTAAVSQQKLDSSDFR